MTKSVLKAAAYVIIVVPSAFIGSTTYALYGMRMTIEVLIGLFLLVLLAILLGYLEPIEEWVASTWIFQKGLKVQKEILRRVK